MPSKPNRSILLILLILNLIVLMGQLWPEGAPPFARAVNIGFLVCSAGYFLTRWIDAGRSRG